MKKQLLFIAVIIATILSANAQYSKFFSLKVAPDGDAPKGDLLSDGTFLYGMTSAGGTNTFGTIFKIRPDSTGYVRLLDFDNANNGRMPMGALISDGTFLYGMTSRGGANGYGVIFKIMPDGSGYVKLLDFAGATNGKNPLGSLTLIGSTLYGMTSEGGTNMACANGCGVFFKIMTDGSGFVKLLDFVYAVNGGTPQGTLSYDGTYFYGMTEQGGANGGGAIFKIMPDGSGFSLLHSFAGTITNGGNPSGSLLVTGGVIYGMVPIGGVNGDGAIFKLMTDGSGYIQFHDFAGTTNGIHGSLITDGTLLYGLTSSDAAGNGAMFSIMPDGTAFTKLHIFTGGSGTGDGNGPQSSLISDGTFVYGTTGGGGAHNRGSLFKYQIGGATMPSAPTTLTVTPLMVSAATGDMGLTWTDNSSNETKFNIERSPDGTTGWVIIDSTLANVAGYTNTGLLPSTQYYYRVNACNSGGCSAYSNVANGTTLANAIESTSSLDNRISVFPNPTTGKCQLSTFNSQLSILEVYNMLGEKVFTIYPLNILLQDVNIDLSNFGKGIYFLRLISETEIITKRLIVN